MPVNIYSQSSGHVTGTGQNNHKTAAKNIDHLSKGEKQRYVNKLTVAIDFHSME